MKIDSIQQNSKWRLCGDWDEAVNYIISKCSKLEQKEYKTWLGGKGDSVGIMQEIKIWSYNQMVYAQARICIREWDA